MAQDEEHGADKQLNLSVENNERFPLQNSMQIPVVQMSSDKKFFKARYVIGIMQCWAPQFFFQVCSMQFCNCF